MTTEDFSVLIVDDNEMNRDTLARRLRQQGFTTTMTGDGREALDLARNQKFDLVLLDIMMPEFDGYQVLETLKTDPELYKIPVIMISALEEIESVMKCMEMGAEDYLTKPFDPVLLKAAIARCLKKSPAPQPITNVKGQMTLLQAEPAPKASSLDASATNANEALPLDEVVNRLLKAGKISRKGYMHFSKAIFNSAFSKYGLTEKECSQINLIFQMIQTGKIKIID